MADPESLACAWWFLPALVVVVDAHHPTGTGWVEAHLPHTRQARQVWKIHQSALSAVVVTVEPSL